jgi:hypothetical protein
MKKYLGDGVFVDYDGFHVVLTTENGLATTNTIYLDPEVLKAFKDYPADGEVASRFGVKYADGSMTITTDTRDPRKLADVLLVIAAENLIGRGGEDPPGAVDAIERARDVIRK